MEKLGLISKCNKLTPWYDEMMIAPKMSRDVSICIDITKSIENIATYLRNTFTARFR